MAMRNTRSGYHCPNTLQVLNLIFSSRTLHIHPKTNTLYTRLAHCFVHAMTDYFQSCIDRIASSLYPYCCYSVDVIIFLGYFFIPDLPKESDVSTSISHAPARLKTPHMLVNLSENQVHGMASRARYIEVRKKGRFTYAYLRQQISLKQTRSYRYTHPTPPNSISSFLRKSIHTRLIQIHPPRL